MFVKFHYGGGKTVLLNINNIASVVAVEHEDGNTYTRVTLNTAGAEYILVNETIDQVSQILKMMTH